MIENANLSRFARLLTTTQQKELLDCLEDGHTEIVFELMVGQARCLRREMRRREQIERQKKARQAP